MENRSFYNAMSTLIKSSTTEVGRRYIYILFQWQGFVRWLDLCFPLPAALSHELYAPYQYHKKYRVRSLKIPAQYCKRLTLRGLFYNQLSDFNFQAYIEALLVNKTKWKSLTHFNLLKRYNCSRSEFELLTEQTNQI